jgi:hypothetical protein
MNGGHHKIMVDNVRNIENINSESFINFCNILNVIRSDLIDQINLKSERLDKEITGKLIVLENVSLINRKEIINDNAEIKGLIEVIGKVMEIELKNGKEELEKLSFMMKKSNEHLENVIRHNSSKVMEKVSKENLE